MCLCIQYCWKCGRYYTHENETPMPRYICCGQNTEMIRAIYVEKWFEMALNGRFTIDDLRVVSTVQAASGTV